MARLKVLFWLAALETVCGLALAGLHVEDVLTSRGDVAVVHSWVEFGLGVALAACGIALMVISRRQALRKANADGASG